MAFACTSGIIACARSAPEVRLRLQHLHAPPEVRNAVLTRQQLAQVHVLLMPHLRAQLHRPAKHRNSLLRARGPPKLRQRKAQRLRRLARRRQQSKTRVRVSGQSTTCLSVDTHVRCRRARHPRAAADGRGETDALGQGRTHAPAHGLAPSCTRCAAVTSLDGA